MTDPEKPIIPGQAPNIAEALPSSATSSTARTETKPAAVVPAGTPGRVLPLRYPFKSGDRTLSEVTFPRRPKAGDLIQGHGTSTPVEQELYQIASLLGLNAEDLKEMDGQDYLAVQREWAAFLGVQ